jgi:predicted transglutaminase-like cysteine proteinase
MIRRSALAFSLVASAFLFAAPMPSASAAPASPAASPSLAGSQSVIEPVQFRRFCRRWHRECRARWGFGWRYRRCMIRHGC